MLGCGQVQPARQVIRADGLNGAVQMHHHHARLLRQIRQRTGQHQSQTCEQLRQRLPEIVVRD